MSEVRNLAGISEDYHNWTLEDIEDAMIPQHAREKGGRDTIFAWLAKYQAAKSSGQDAINGTVGSLLEDDGNLAVNPVVSSSLREQADLELSAYAPLPGLPHFRTLVPELAFGDGLPVMLHHGIHLESISTPGGTGALYLSARNLLKPGTTLLLRDRHWGPYQTIIKECGLEIATWPLMPSSGDGQIDVEALDGVLNQLVQEQNQVLAWLNDPAHNPTGMSVTTENRRLVLERFVSIAEKNPTKGITLFVDGAYAAYAKNHHGWGDTLALFSSEVMWPQNLLLCYGFSASKSHTLYGQRCGALIMIHPNKEFLE